MAPARVPQVWASLAGQGGLFGAFLGASFWQPLKNLTFGVYLVHVRAPAAALRPVPRASPEQRPAREASPPPPSQAAGLKVRPARAQVMVIDLLYHSFNKTVDYTDYLGAYVFVGNYTLAVAAAAALWFLAGLRIGLASTYGTGLASLRIKIGIFCDFST
jgi:hypothetical protein